MLLQAAKLKLNWDRCQIGLSEVVFTGYHISKNDFLPPELKISWIIEADSAFEHYKQGIASTAN